TAKKSFCPAGMFGIRSCCCWYGWRTRCRHPGCRQFPRGYATEEKAEQEREEQINEGTGAHQRGSMVWPPRISRFGVLKNFFPARLCQVLLGLFGLIPGAHHGHLLGDETAQLLHLCHLLGCNLMAH